MGLCNRWGVITGIYFGLNINGLYVTGYFFGLHINGLNNRGASNRNRFLVYIKMGLCSRVGRAHNRNLFWFTNKWAYMIGRLDNFNITGIFFFGLHM